MLGLSISSNDFADSSHGYEANLMENVVFVLIWAVHTHCQLLSRYSKVHRLKLSHGCEHFFGPNIVLEFKVADSALLTDMHSVYWHVVELNPR